MRKVSSHVLATLVILICTSCGQQEKSYHVSGLVTFNGSPASGAVVFFHRQGNGDSANEAVGAPIAIGVAQEDGSFELMSASSGKGLPPGDYVVLVEWKKENGQRQRHGPDLLKGRYADPKKPLLHATVETKANHLSPFELCDASQRPRL